MTDTTQDPKQKRTLVEEGTEFRGTITSDCPVVVMGKVDGELEAPAIDVTRTGEIVGTIRADNLRSEGAVAGNVEAEGVYLSGSVRSDTVIRASTLEVKLARRGGKLEVTFGEGVAAEETDEDTDQAEAASDKVVPHTPPNPAPESSPADVGMTASNGNDEEDDEAEDEERDTNVDELFAAPGN